MKITRRAMLIGSAVLAGSLAVARGIFPLPKPTIPGAILGAASSAGHRLRHPDFPSPSETIDKELVIIGGGIAGLAAGYRLAQCGMNDFMMLELEDHIGGNSHSGVNEVSAYPWGAHYVPLLTAEATAVHKLFEELGIITEYDKAHLPVYNEFYLGSDPHERLYINGVWIEGLVPAIGASPEEHMQIKRFFHLMEHYKNAKGNDGKRAFAIPLDKSSQDSDFLALDHITMTAWLTSQHFTSPHLLWYIHYCCRDDYGATANDVSAWAGIHYFAARNGTAANTTSYSVITWPEGNGWLVKRLAAPFADKIQTNAITYHVEENGSHVIIDYCDRLTNKSTRIRAKTAIIAAPRFVAARILSPALSAEPYQYSPWMVANITLSKLPEGYGEPLSWDNVVYDSQLIGYVTATHQHLDMKPLKTVLTYYWPLSHLPPAEARTEALHRPYEEWQRIILAELLAIHPELEGHVERVDIWLWGHGMIRPTPGFIWGDARRSALLPKPPIFFAHSDMSGISIFEEAYTHGVTAAEHALGYLNIPYQSVL